jgi:hypothetical protein
VATQGTMWSDKSADEFQALTGCRLRLVVAKPHQVVSEYISICFTYHIIYSYHIVFIFMRRVQGCLIFVHI